jgi:hypothetical protein
VYVIWFPSVIGSTCTALLRVPDDELLTTELARLDRKIDAPDTERRRLIDLYQGGLSNSPKCSAAPPKSPHAEKSCSTSESASLTNEPRSPATTSFAAACTTSPPASTPSSTPSTTPKNSSCCVSSHVRLRLGLRRVGSVTGSIVSQCRSDSYSLFGELRVSAMRDRATRL